MDAFSALYWAMAAAVLLMFFVNTIFYSVLNQKFGAKGHLPFQSLKSFMHLGVAVLCAMTPTVNLIAFVALFIWFVMTALHVLFFPERAPFYLKAES